MPSNSSTASADRDLRPWIVEERRSLLATFEQLDDDAWDVPSLCGGWTVRHVLGHLIQAARPPLRRYAGAVLRTHGDFDQANHDLAVGEAEQPTARLLCRYRDVVDHLFGPPGWPAAAPLADVMLHALDVRMPIGVRADRLAERYVPVLELLASRRGQLFSPAGRPTLRWEAVDHTWTSGTGPVVRGTIADLALTASGRPARLDMLDGPGVSALRMWLT